MPLYELFCVAKPTLQKPDLAKIIKRTAQLVMQSDGVLTDIKYYGVNSLAKAVKSGRDKYTDAAMFSVHFALNPTVLKELEHDLRVDENIMRWVVKKRQAAPPLPNMSEVFKEKL